MGRRIISTVTMLTQAIVLATAAVMPAMASADTGTFRITGRATRIPSNNTVPNVSVTATDPGGTTVEYGPVLTDFNGFYNLDVNPGVYDLHFDPPASTDLQPLVSSNVAISGNLTINAKLLRFPHILSGALTVADGTPLVNASVYVVSTTQGSQNQARTCTDATGHYTLSLQPDTYRMNIGVSNANYFNSDCPYLPPPGTKAPTGDFSISGLSDAYQKVDLTSEDVTKDFIFPTSKLTIIVKNANGDPIVNKSAYEQEGRIYESALVPGGSDTALLGTSRLLPLKTDANGQISGYMITGAKLPAGTICANAAPIPVFCNTTDYSLTGDLTVTIQQPPVTPAVPTNLTIASPTKTPQLNWNSSNGAASYKVYRDGTSIATPTNTNYIDSNATEGTHSYYVTAVNSGGESAHSNTVSALVDRAAPSISYTASPVPNAQGWNSNDVLVTFTCSDTSSGVASCSSPVTVSAEGAGQVVAGTATDNAGNTASVTATVSLDKTKPVITTALDQTPNGNGWNNAPVTVTYTCSDGLSAILTCSAPQTESADGIYVLEGVATDNAGNLSTTNVTVSIDQTAPTISYSLSPAPNSANWNKGDVVVTFSCSDSLSGIQACPAPVTVSAEGANQTVTPTATDNAGNSASVTATVNLDRTVPVVDMPTWSTNPLQQGQSTTLSTTVSDNLSGVASVQYAIDGGAAQPMTFDSASGTWQATFGSSLAANTYNVTITATDNAGNTSTGTTDVLAVYTTSNGYVAGHAKVQPSASDTMPIALDTSGSPANLVLGFTNVTAPTSGSFDIDYSIKKKQNEFSLSSTNINWVIVQDSTHASILGHADLTTYVNGVKTVTQNVSVRFDLALGTNGSPDQIVIKIFNPGLNPNTDAPTYTISAADIPNGSNLMIHP